VRPTKNLFLFLPVVLLTGVTLCAQPFWQKKKYTSWSKEEAKKMLEDSPWSGSYAFNAMAMEILQQSTADSRARESRPFIRYNVQLHSAPPIRQAMVRLEQIALKYGQLPPEKKQVFDQDSGKFLGATFNDVVRVHVEYTTNVPALDRDLANYWQNGNPTELQSYIYLITPNGKRLPPLRFTVAKGAERSFDLIFPRKLEGQPILDPPDGALSLEFPHPRIGQMQDGRVLVEFKGSKMMVDGKPVY